MPEEVIETQPKILKKEIEPVMATINPDDGQCSHIHVSIVHDDLQNSCRLFYALFDTEGNIPLQRNMDMDVEAYQAWDGNNDYPYQYVAQKLNLVLIP